MDDKILVRVLYGSADTAEELEPIIDGKIVLTAIVVNGNSIHILHYEVRDAIGGHASVQKARNIGMIEVRQNLPLGAETKQHALRGPEPGVHQLDDASLPIQLIGASRQVNCAHSAFADNAQKFVRANPFSHRLRFDGLLSRYLHYRVPGKPHRFCRGTEEGFDFLQQVEVRATGLLDKPRTSC